MRIPSRLVVRYLALVGTCVLIGLASSEPGEAAPAPPIGESLGDDLLEDLGANLPSDLEPSAGSLPVDSASPSNVERPLRMPRDPDRQLFKKWSDQQGEDLGAASRESPLDHIEAAMRQAQGLIAEKDKVAQGVEVQQQVVAELDALIDQLAKQCATSEKPGESKRKNPGSRRSQVPSPKSGAQQANQGKVAAEDSSTRLERGSAAEVDMDEMQGLLKDLWGHLPERVREQLLQAPSDEFLPKYELEIEKYFRRLAEEGRQDESRP